jgi:general secretion pathway protein D
MSLRITVMAALALACALPTLVAAGPGKRGEPASKEAQLVQVYPVADLVVPILDFCDATQQKTTLETRLIELITATVAPKSWMEHGGKGTVQYVPLGMALVVNQAPAVQEQVADLLRALRRLQDVEVSVEVRIVEVSPWLADRFRAKAGFAPTKSANGESFVASTTFNEALGLKTASKIEIGGSAQDTAIFTEKELYPWLVLLQSDGATNLMQAPKITMANGQRACLADSTRQSFVTEYKDAHDKDKLTVVPQTEDVDVGLKATFLPTVSADRRSVRLAVDFRRTDLVAIKVGMDKEFRGIVQIPQVDTLTCKQSCVIPDGHTMAVSLGQVMVETLTESPVSFLSRIPYVSRLVKTVGYSREARDVFLLITPRVIVNEDEEQVFLKNLRTR